jgi:hypothetical protein
MPDGQSLPGKKRRGDPNQPGGRMTEGQNRQGGKSQGALSLLGVKSQGIPDGMSKEEKIEKSYLREGQSHLDQRLAGTPASQVEVREERVRGVTDEEEGEGLVRRGGKVEMSGPTLMPGSGHLSHQRKLL